MTTPLFYRVPLKQFLVLLIPFKQYLVLRSHLNSCKLKSLMFAFYTHLNYNVNMLAMP